MRACMSVCNVRAHVYVAMFIKASCPGVRAGEEEGSRLLATLGSALIPGLGLGLEVRDEIYGRKQTWCQG